MSSTDDTISLGSFARAFVQTLVPNVVSISKSLARLATLKGESIDSIGLQLERCARRHPRRIALRFEDRAWTYAEFNGWANRIAHVLRLRGVVAGDCVAVLMENRPELLACVAGIVKIGAVAGMLNHQQRGAALSHSLRLTEAELLIVGDECIAALESTPYGPKGEQADVVKRLWDGAGGAPFGYQNLRTEQVNAPSVNLAETRGIVAKSPAFYVFTSGTTGLPKASIMSHLRWLKSMAGLGQGALRLNGDDVFYCPLPLYHNNALTLSWGAALGSGCTLALGRKFSASKFWDEVRHHDATAFCYIGETLRYLLNRPQGPSDREHRVRVIVGNGLRPEIWDAFQKRFGIGFIAEFYGASESNVAFINVLGLPRTVGFCPMPFAVVEYDAETQAPVLDADGRMRRVPRGGVGLLIGQVTQSTPYDGYTDAKASERKLFHDVFAVGDLWYNSGDLVRDQGFRHIAFVDRVGDTFRWRGENVATTEVESALNQHPQVEHAVVYGVQVPGMDGRAGMASLTWRGGAFDGAGLAAFLRERLPAYAVPLFIRLRSEQEVTGTFKFRKVEIRDEGFDPARVSDPLHVLGQAGYEPMSPGLFGRIQSGDVRF